MGLSKSSLCTLAGLWSALSIVLYGCVTSGPTDASRASATGAKPTPVKDDHPYPPPGIAFDYELLPGAGTAAMTNCHIHFARQGSAVTVEARLIPAASRILVKVPPGAYQLLDASCDAGQRFTMPRVLPFAVDQEAVTYLGGFRLAQSAGQGAPEQDVLTVDDKDSETTAAALEDLAKRQLKVQRLRWSYHKGG